MSQKSGSIYNDIKQDDIKFIKIKNKLYKNTRKNSDYEINIDNDFNRKTNDILILKKTNNNNNKDKIRIFNKVNNILNIFNSKSGNKEDGKKQNNEKTNEDKKCSINDIEDNDEGLNKYKKLIKLKFLRRQNDNMNIINSKELSSNRMIK